jgi:hypothetical protein
VTRLFGRKDGNLVSTVNTERFWFPGRDYAGSRKYSFVCGKAAGVVFALAYQRVCLCVFLLFY